MTDILTGRHALQVGEQVPVFLLLSRFPAFSKPGGQAGQFIERIGELVGEHPTFPVTVALVEPADVVD